MTLPLLPSSPVPQATASKVPSGDTHTLDGDKGNVDKDDDAGGDTIAVAWMVYGEICPCTRVRTARIPPPITREDDEAADDERDGDDDGADDDEEDDVDAVADDN